MRGGEGCAWKPLRGGEPGLGDLIGDKVGDAEVCGDLRCGATVFPFCCPEALLFCAANARGEIGEQRDGQYRDRGCMPRAVGKATVENMGAGGDDNAGDRCGCGGAEFDDDEAEKQAEAKGPDGYGG